MQHDAASRNHLAHYHYDSAEAPHTEAYLWGHLVRPGDLLRFAKRLLRAGGYLIISTPYHGYLKNLVLALTNKWDAHLSPFWDGGHIKFWSRRTLSQLLNDAGFHVVRFIGAGRLPFLWKSMIIVAQRPSGDAK